MSVKELIMRPEVKQLLLAFFCEILIFIGE